MKILIYSILAIFSFSFLPKGAIQTTSKKSEEINLFKDPILVGELQLEQIQNLNWYTENYNGYKPNKKVIEQIKSVLTDKNIHIEIYFGTWCPDSRYEVPSLIKLLNLVEFDLNNITLIGLDRDKKVPNVSKEEAEALDIQMIPTFIFYENKIEMNRFVEFAVNTLEEDVLAILADKNYKHSYK